MDQAHSSRQWCKYCGSDEEPVVFHGSTVCSCGAVLDQVFAHLPNFNGWGSSSGRNGDIDGATHTWLTLTRKGAKGAQASAARKVLTDRARASEQRSFVRALLSTVTGQAATVHFYVQRVLDTHHQLKSASQQLKDQPHHIVGLKWSMLDTPDQGKAVLAACTYLVFREADRYRGATQRDCFSIHFIASCAQVPVQRVLRWFRGIAYALPHRVGDIGTDEPMLHIDQIVSFFRVQVSLSRQDASSSPSLLGTQVRQSRLLLSADQLRLLSSITDFDELRYLARSLTDQLLSAEPLRTAVFHSSKMRISSGEWAYFFVLWAIGGIVRKRLIGSEWLKRNLLTASLGGKSLSPNRNSAAGGSDSDMDEQDEWQGMDEEEATSQSISLQDLPPSHVTQYTEIGQAIAQHALRLPWVTSLPKGGNRKKRSSGRGGGPHVVRIREGEEVLYIKAIADFAVDVSRRRAEEDRLGDRYGQKGKGLHRGGGSGGVQPSEDGGHYSSTPSSFRKPSSHLEEAVAYLTSVAVTDSPGGDSEALSSYASLHHPSLVNNSSLIESLSDETVDALLFDPDEMETYLRSDEEVAILRTIRSETGDWSSGAKMDIENAIPTGDGSGERPVLKKRKVAKRGDGVAGSIQG